MQESGNFMITDAALQVAAEEVAMAMLRDVPAEPHTFSARFEKKMKRLLHRAKHPVGYQVVRYAAAVLLAITVLFGAAFAASPEVRAAVVNWVKTMFHEFFEYSSHETVSSDVEYEYYPPEEFEGYSLLTEINEENGKTYIFVNEAGELLQFSYARNGNASMFVKTENYDVHHGVVDTLPADVYISKFNNEANVIVWQDPSNNVLFAISAYADQEELQKMAGMIEKREKM